jgi:hypothetical protein
VAAIAVGCGQTRLRLATDPPRPDVPIAVDGRRAGKGKLDRPVPYFGTIAVSTAPPPAETDPTAPLRPLVRDVSADLRVPPPVSPWLFPFDFVIEAGGRATGLVSRNRTFELTVEEHALDDQGVPADLQDLQARARARATRR